jgi:hypothetical protein
LLHAKAAVFDEVAAHHKAGAVEPCSIYHTRGVQGFVGFVRGRCGRVLSADDSGSRTLGDVAYPAGSLIT